MNANDTSVDTLDFGPPEGLLLSGKQRLAEILPFSAYQVKEVSLLKAASDADDDRKFVLFTKDFMQLQLVITQALTLPAAQGDFEAKYGSFDKKSVVTECVAALKALQTHCQLFGNPSVLVTEISKLAEGAKPTTIYGKLVWLSHQIANTAENFKSTFKYLPAELKKQTTPAEKVAYLKDVLMGDGGLIGEAIKMKSEADALYKEVLAYLSEMNRVKAPVMTYFSTSKGEKSLYAEAKSKHEDLTKRVEAIQKEVEALGDEYLKYVAITTGVTVGLMVISMGMLWPVSAVTGGVLGSMTENLRKQRNALSEELDRVRGDEKKKATLVSDVNGFSPAIDRVAHNLDNVCKGLAVIGGVWGNVVNRLQAISATTPESLSGDSVNNVTRKINAARDKWDEIVEATYQFTADAFVEIKEEKSSSSVA
jgi:hypothetical protein